MIGRKTLLGSAAALGAVGGARAQAKTIKLGVLNDMSEVFKDTGGPISQARVRQAVQDFGDHGFAVEVVSADHQNKPDVGVAIARQWFDRDGVDALDLPTSSVALAVNSVVAEKDKVVLASGGGTPDLTRGQCTPNTVAWTFDTYMLARSTGGAMTRAGGDSWFFIEAISWPTARPRHQPICEGSWRQGAGPGSLPIPRDRRRLIFPAPGAAKRS
jgi:branched-chain amino acid transport system substrate-binding protein